MTNYIVRTIEGHDVEIAADLYHVNQSGVLEVGNAAFAPGKWVYIGEEVVQGVSPLDGSTVGQMSAHLTDIAYHLANGVHDMPGRVSLLGSLKALEDLTPTLKHEVRTVAYAD